MAGFHRNIFSYYRGAAQREQDREQQLEDNTTKALVNTLECTVPEVATKFLEWLGVSAPNPSYCELQKPSIGEERIRRTSDRLLLAIVGTDDEANHSVCKQLPTPPIGDSRPDAWLYGDGFVVLLETKTGNSALGLNQMACHWHKLQPTRWKILTWAFRASSCVICTTFRHDGRFGHWAHTRTLHDDLHPCRNNCPWCWCSLTLLKMEVLPPLFHAKRKPPQHKLRRFSSLRASQRQELTIQVDYHLDSER